MLSVVLSPGSTVPSLQAHQLCPVPRSSREDERPPGTRRFQEEELPECTGQLSGGVGADWGGETLLPSPPFLQHPWG